ncbi:uncharacterized protein LOC113348015 [Papaver somniferum]|uniref:uncharacterized protein LOC113348015 n=1 Tax=Papaver somniferum TaxID=3469 RepID=UPI000E6F48BD|nr:uncharacterized protein LOC113348015 [Papaver somniferum]
MVVFQASPLNITILIGTSPMDIIQFWINQPDQGIMLNLGSCFLWNIWKTRNDKVFNNIQSSVQPYVHKALQDFKNFDLHHVLNYCSSVHIQYQTTIQWKPPPPYHIKINVDAAYSDGKGAAAAIAADSAGSHLGSGALYFDSFSLMVAEEKDYGLGSQLARRIQGSRIIIEGDAEDIPKAITGNKNDIPWSIHSTILSIQDGVKDFSEIIFTAAPRDGNSIAQDFVQFAISNFQNRWWSHDDPPFCIMQRLNFFED